MPSEHPLRHTIITLLWGVLIFAFLLYQFPEDRRITLFFINKAAAEAAVIFIGVSFLLGPLCKIFHFLSHHIRYRKYFGLLGFAFVVFHITTSLLQWQDRFTFNWYIDHGIGIIAAIIATLIFLVLTVTSHNSLIRKLGGHQWKIIQRTGYVALILTLVHIYVVASGRWQQWFDGKVDMPTSFLLFSFVILVLVARIAALIADYFKSHETPPPQPANT